MHCHSRRASQSIVNDGSETIRWSHQDIKPRLLNQAAELFAEGMTVREVAATLRISKSEAGRLRIRAVDDGLLTMGESTEMNNQQIIVQ